MATLRKITLNWEIRTGAITCDTGYIKRQELCDVDLYVTVDGTPYALDTSWAINLSIKPALLGDNAALVAVTTWTASATTGLYQATAQTIGGTALDTYLAANNADTTDDEGNKLVDLDVYYTVSMAMQAKSDTVTVICKPDVGRADDTVPATIIARNDFLVTNGTGLLVNVAAGYAANGAFVAAQSSLAITNATNYIEVTAAGVASVNTTAFTAGSYPLATVVASAGAITANTDLRAWITPKPATSTGLTVGTTAIASGTSGRILYDNAGVLGELPVGTGVATALAINVGSAGAFVTTVPAVVKSNGVTSLFYTPTANTAAARGVALAAAIAACASGDEIRIGPGTFDGNITLPAGVVLRGAGEQFTTINGTITRSSPAQAYNVFDLRASDGNQPAVLTQTWASQSSASGSGYSALMWCHNVQLQPDATWTRLSAGRGHRLALENDFQPNDTGAVRQEFNWDLFADGAAGPNVNVARRIFHFEILNDGTRGSNYVYGNFGANGALKSETTDGTPAYLQANSTGDIFGTGSSATRNIQWNVSTIPLGADTAGGNIVGGSNNFLNIEPFDQAGYVVFCNYKGSGIYLGSGTAGFFTVLTAPATGTLRVTTNGSTLGTVEAATGTFTSTSSLLLGTAGSAVGNVGFRNATSGTTTLAPATGALGTGTVTLPLSGTLATLEGSNTYTGTTNTFTLPTTTGTTTTSGIAVAANSLTTGTGIYAASSSLTSGKLLDLQVSGTAAAASQTALNVATAGANGTSGITSKGAVISNTHTGTTSTNVALELTASGGTTNTALNVTAGNTFLSGNLLFTDNTYDIGNSGAPFYRVRHIYSTGTITALQSNITVCGATYFSDALNTKTYVDTTGTGWIIIPRATTTVPFTCRGMASQTADLQRWTDSSASVLAKIAADGSFTTTGTLAVTGASTLTGLLTANGGITLGDAQNIAFNTTTGTKIGATTSQKLSFWNATPIVQPTTAVSSATVASPGGGTNIKTDDTFDGYTIAQVVKALRNAGLLA